MGNVVGQFAKILPSDAKARKQFVTSGGLKKIQEIKADPETELGDAIMTINECFPEEIVRYYSPGYSKTLLERLDDHTPASQKAAAQGGHPVAMTCHLFF